MAISKPLEERSFAGVLSVIFFDTWAAVLDESESLCSSEDDECDSFDI